MLQWEGEQHRVSLGQCSLDSGSGVHSVCVGILTIASGNSDNFNSLFYGVACPQTIPESKATNKHCREVWLHLQAAMMFSTGLYVPICWFRRGN